MAAVRLGLYRKGQTDRRFAISVVGVCPCRFVPVFMRIVQSWQMDAVVTFGMRMRMQQRRHALEQGEQEYQQTAMERLHGWRLDSFQPLLARETLNKAVSGFERRAHGAQDARHLKCLNPCRCCRLPCRLGFSPTPKASH